MSTQSFPAARFSSSFQVDVSVPSFSCCVDSAPLKRMWSHSGLKHADLKCGDETKRKLLPSHVVPLVNASVQIEPASEKKRAYILKKARFKRFLKVRVFTEGNYFKIKSFTLRHPLILATFSLPLMAVFVKGESSETIESRSCNTSEQDDSPLSGSKPNDLWLKSKEQILEVCRKKNRKNPPGSVQLTWNTVKTGGLLPPDTSELLPQCLQCSLFQNT